jgi:replicative DNA helicase
MPGKDKRPDRTPPHANDAEQAVLGAMLIDNARIPIVRAKIRTSKVFYSPAHRKIYDAIIILNNFHQAVDITTVGFELERRGDLDACGKRTYLSDLATVVATGANVEHYADIVIEQYQYRQVIDFANDMIADSFSRMIRPNEILDGAIGHIFKTRSQAAGTGPVRMSDLAVPMVEEVDAVQSGEKTIGIPTGFIDLDEKTGGFSPGLLVLAGLSGMGKTAAMDQISQYMGTNGQTTYIRSIETSKEHYAMRHYCSIGEIDSMGLKTGKATDGDLQRFSEAINDTGSQNVLIDDSTDSDIHTIIADIYAAKSTYDIDIVFIDHLQLITSTDRLKRHEQLARYCKMFVALWKDLKIPIVVLCQITLGRQERRNTRPTQRHLRGSGDIHQDADLVLVIHRPEVYATKKELDKGMYSGTAELFIRKQRNGPTGMVELLFSKQHTRFSNIQRMPEIEEPF